MSDETTLSQRVLATQLRMCLALGDGSLPLGSVWHRDTIRNGLSRLPEGTERDPECGPIVDALRAWVAGAGLPPGLDDRAASLPRSETGDWLSALVAGVVDATAASILARRVCGFWSDGPYGPDAPEGRPIYQIVGRVA